MTNQQLNQAIQMHQSGMTSSIIVAYFKTTIDALRRKLKNYEQTNQTIHGTT